MKKTLFFIVFLLILISVLYCLSIAHSGGTDGNGGHYNHSTGEYHYHHGKPAHDHPNGVCPYASNKKENESNTTFNGILFFLISGAICVVSWFMDEETKRKNHQSKNALTFWGLLWYFSMVLLGISVCGFLGFLS